jgi:hypothetical protein
MKKKTHFSNHLIEKLHSMGWKFLAWNEITCARNNLAKKHVWLRIETHFEIF